MTSKALLQPMKCEKVGHSECGAGLQICRTTQVADALQGASCSTAAGSITFVAEQVLKFWVQHVTRVMVSSVAVMRKSWQPVAEMLAACLARLPPW